MRTFPPISCLANPKNTPVDSMAFTERLSTRTHMNSTAGVLADASEDTEGEQGLS